MLISLDPPAQIAAAARIQEQYRSDRAALQRKLDQVLHALLAGPTRAEAYRKALAVFGRQPSCERCRKPAAGSGHLCLSCRAPAPAPAGAAASSGGKPAASGGNEPRQDPAGSGEPPLPPQEIRDAAERFAATWESLLVTYLPYDFNYHCGEADAAAALYLALSQDDPARMLLRNHSEHDPDCTGHKLPSRTPPPA